MRTQILFIDDDIRVLGSFERVVHSYRHEWECRYLSKSEEAIPMLEQAPADLVVTDVRMPHLDGLELLRRIKEHPQLKDIEVIVVTGLADRSLKQNALELGAADLLNKPVSNEELIARLRGLSRMKRYQDELRRKNRELEQQLLVNQKMHLIGLLAGGTVHDLNNLLGLVKGYGQLLMGSGNMEPSVSEDLLVMLHSVDRAST
jgi:PleD family two-component response regulator